MFSELNKEVWRSDDSVRAVDNFEECRRYISGEMKGFRLSSRDCFEFVKLHHRYIQFGESRVDFVQFCCGREFAISQPAELDPYYYIKLVISGRCKLTMGSEAFFVSSGQGAAINPYGPLAAQWEGHCETVIIRLNRDGIIKTLADELNVEVLTPLRFASAPVTAAQCHPMTALMDMLLRHSQAPASFEICGLDRDVERLVYLAALRCFLNNYSEMLQNPRSAVAPFYIRAAEEYILNYCQEDITLADLSKATGVSTRSLFYGFRRWRHTTPKAHIKKTRLNIARDALRLAAKTGASVTQIAIASGYRNLSRFSTDYKFRFGEAPSQTLRRGKSGLIPLQDENASIFAGDEG